MKGNKGYSKRNDTFYTSAISSHDRSRYIANGRELYFGYAEMFSPFIPFFYQGEEFNASYTTVSGAIGDILYFNRIKWNELSNQANKDFLNKVKKLIKIRKQYKNIIAPFKTQLKDTNIISVNTFSTTDLPAYAFWGNNKIIIVIGVKNKHNKTSVKVKVPFVKGNISGFSKYKITDLLQNQEIIINKPIDDTFDLGSLKDFTLKVFLIEPVS